MEQLETAEEARKTLKGELATAQDKIIELEEDVYGLKTTNGELLEKLKESEDGYEEAVNELEEVSTKLDEAEARIKELELNGADRLGAANRDK